MILRAAVALSLAAAGPGVGCRGASKASDAGAAPTTSSSLVSSPISVETSSPEQAWIEARTADPLELARLVNLEGVHKLADVAADEHASAEDRATAIRAVGYANDPTPALEVLTRLAMDPSNPSSPSNERSTLALQTIARVAPRRAPIEELEPGAWRTCGDGLLAALKAMQGAVRRELAIAALRSLADRGAVNAASIPAH